MRFLHTSSKQSESWTHTIKGTGDILDRMVGYFLKILLSVLARSLFMFSRCRIMTASGMAVAVMSSGHRSAKFQLGVRIIARIRARRKAIDAAIDAKETDRQIKTTAAHTTTANAAQMV